MTTDNETCVWVECDGPDSDRDRGWPDEGPSHFDTVTAALGYVVGMARTQLWYPRPTGRGGQWRHCTHCGGAHEERLAEMGAG